MEFEIKHISSRKIVMCPICYGSCLNMVKLVGTIKINQQGHFYCPDCKKEGQYVLDVMLDA